MISESKGVALDFDGVIADTGSAKADWIRRNISSELTLQKFDRSSLLPLIGADAYLKMQQCVGFETTLLCAPVAGAIEGLHALANRFDLHVVSFRDRGKREWMIKWLKKHCLSRYFKSISCDTGLPKLRTASNLNCFALVDDDARHLLGHKNLTVHRILFGRAYSLREHSLPVAATWPRCVNTLKSFEKPLGIE